MSDMSDQYCGELLLVYLRKIIQAVSLHSKDLKRKFGLTVPQLIILQQVAYHEAISVSELAKSVSLSQATVTDIVTRLIANGFLKKARSDTDKRRMIITPLQKCHEMLEQTPPPLQEAFTARFAKLEHWEQLMLLTSLSRIVYLMSIEKIEALPILATGTIEDSL